MNTLIHIKELLEIYRKESEKSLDSNNKNNLDSNFLDCIYRLVNIYPNLLFPLCNIDISNEMVEKMISRIRELAQNNYTPVYPTEQKYIDVINGKIIETPVLANGKTNRWISYSRLFDFIIGLLISLPINKIHITFVDLGNESYGNFIDKKINPKLYSLIKKKSDLRLFLDKMSKRVSTFRQKYKNYPTYCLENKTIPQPYEFIIFLDFYSNESINESFCKQYLNPLSGNGEDGGVYLIDVDTEEKKIKMSSLDITIKPCHLDVRKIIGTSECEDYFSYSELKINYRYTKEELMLLKKTSYKCIRAVNEFDNNIINHFYLKDTGKGDLTVKSCNVSNMTVNSKTLLKCHPLSENERLLKGFINYINTEADKKEKTILENKTNNTTNTYEKIMDTIIVPIGKSSNAEVNFTMDMVSHVHSFIIGQSGSGKSVFLHNIIGSAILKYAPEDLQLYLLDFKLGGVEFNRYKGIKHVKSLLVDNSDQQITLEILRELRERMIERGRQLRDCSVNNLVEYNKQNPNATMPQILVVVDECHEMFRVGSDIPRTVSNEILEIITKIAKEGRSQGVHLILATQTLSGTEISNEILNNVSDHYLLKCATSDSERMVERSSEITSKLSTGQIYYHHVDSQVQFQAYYTDKENAAKLIDLAKKKAENHQSNGEFYFNGSQLFKLDTTVMEQGKKRAKYPIAYMGRNISINQNDLNITLRKDYSENILLFGLNDVEQVTRTTMNLFISLISYTQSKRLDYKFKVFNCLSNEDSIYTEQLELLEEEGYCEIIEGRKDRGKFLKQLAEDISNETVENTILLILGQERFRELKMDMEISNEKKQESSDDAFGFGGFSFSNEGTSSSSIKTFKQALELILDKGPELGVHTIMQLDKPSNFLFSDYISPKLVYQKFKHLIMLKSDESASAQLHLNDNIRLETLSKDLERLRAYYYSEESDTYTLFTPYMELNNEEIMNLLKSE